MHALRLAIPYLAALACTAVAPPALAQRGAQAGAGIGITQSDRVSGQARHVMAAVDVPALSPFRIGIEGLYQRGEGTASPMACAIFTTVPCFGRTDRNAIAGIGVVAKPYLRLWPGLAAVYPVVGAGVYHRRTRSTEATTPTTPGGVPRSEERRTSATSPGYTLGIGMVSARRGLQPFLEINGTQLLEGGASTAGAVPVTLGVRF